MFKSWLKKIGIVFIELALLGGALWFVAQKRGVEYLDQITPALQQEIAKQQEKEIPFPEAVQPVDKRFRWDYKGVKYDLTLKLDSAVYEYYHTQPKSYSYSGTLSQDWEEEYYGMFLKSNSNDQTITKLTEDLSSLGKKHNLNEDQIVDLILAFVQSIEYDDAKAANILDRAGKETMLYPYELLYQQKGVCSDKSLLALAILRQMGYGGAIFTYPEDNHMAIGIQCPEKYSTYGSGYCYAETTATGNRIGIIPGFDSASNKTVVAKELSDFDSNQIQAINLKQLGQMSIFQKTSGKQYAGIIETTKISNEIDALKKSMETMLPVLQAQKKTIAKEEKQLADMKKELEKYQNDQNVEKYNALVKKYNDFLESYKKDVKKYNETAALYNKTVQRYNILIKQ